MDQQQLMELLGGAGGFPHALASMGRHGRAVLETQRFVGQLNPSNQDTFSGDTEWNQNQGGTKY